jgi:hypothetical protein
VDAGGEGHLELGADAVGAADEHGVFDVSRHAAQPREAADAADDFGDAGGRGEGLDALDELVPRVDVDSGALIRER